MKSPRTSLKASLLRDLLDLANCAQVELQVHDQVGSTNDEALLAQQSAPDTWILVVADQQTTGRGRLGRDWVSPWGAGIAMTIAIPQSDLTAGSASYSLVAGLAMTDALASYGVGAGLKWPNDIVVINSDSGAMFKLGGILSQMSSQGIVVGVGVNIDLRPEELPIAQATSTWILGHQISREELIATFVKHVKKRLAQNSLEFMSEYRAACVTIGLDVTVDLVNGTELSGNCCGVTDAGLLQVKFGDSVIDVATGDVHHVRAAGSNLD